MFIYLSELGGSNSNFRLVKVSNFPPDTQRYGPVVLRWGIWQGLGSPLGLSEPGMAPGVSWGEPRDAAGRPTTHRMVPTAKTSRGLGLGRAEVVTSRGLAHTPLESGVQGEPWRGPSQAQEHPRDASVHGTSAPGSCGPMRSCM